VQPGLGHLVNHMKKIGEGERVRYELDMPKLQAHDPHRDADARQRDRHQLLRGGQGAQLELKHRPVGLGIMGFQDCLHMLREPYASSEAIEFADRSMEAVCYYAYWASTELAQEARPLCQLSGLAVGPRNPAAGHGEAAARRARRLCRSRRFGDARMGSVALADQAVRDAQFELRGDRADGDDLQHHRGLGVHRAVVSEHFREVEPVGASSPSSMNIWSTT